MLPLMIEISSFFLLHSKFSLKIHEIYDFGFCTLFLIWLYFILRLKNWNSADFFLALRFLINKFQKIMRIAINFLLVKKLEKNMIDLCFKTWNRLHQLHTLGCWFVCVVVGLYQTNNLSLGCLKNVVWYFNFITWNR